MGRFRGPLTDGEEALDGVQPRTGCRREVEGPARVTVEPGTDLLVLVGGVVVEDHVDDLTGRDVALEGVQEADELLMAMVLHVPPEDLAGEHVERREERGRAVALVVVGQGRAAPLPHRQAGLGPIESLNLRLLVDREDQSVGGRTDVEPDDVVQLFDEGGVVGEFELPPAMRGEAVGLPDLLNRGELVRALDKNELRVVVLEMVTKRMV